MIQCCESEQWADVPGYPGLYEVSTCGQVRARRKMNAAGVWLPAKLLKPGLRGGNLLYKHVILRQPGEAPRGYGVSRLVLEAFLGAPEPPANCALHGPAGQLDNHLSNLRWGTRSDNMLDRQRDGTDRNAAKTHCSKGHPFDAGNTYLATNPRNGNGMRQCRQCKLDRQRVARE